MENTPKGLLVALLVLMLMAGLTQTKRVFNYQDELHFSEVRREGLAAAYTDHLYREYSKTICGIDTPKLDGTDNRAGTERDLACMAGVKEKAKKEVETVTK